MIKIFKNGLLGSNTYLVYDNKSLEGMLVDCGNEPRQIETFCENMSIKIKYIVLTHGHYDHADYVRAYKSLFKGATVVAHSAEKAVLSDSEANVSELVGETTTYPMPDMTVEDGDTLRLGYDDEMSFTVLHTPGHTPGGICLYCEKEKILFTGDTLFHYGRGRTDFKYGDETEILASIKRLTELDGDTVFYPGHGESGVIRNERNIWC